MTTFTEVEVSLLCHLPLAEPRISEIISDFGDYAIIWDYYPKFPRVIEREFPLAQPFLGKICCILTLSAMVKCPQRVTRLLSPMLCREKIDSMDLLSALGQHRCFCAVLQTE